MIMIRVIRCWNFQFCKHVGVIFSWNPTVCSPSKLYRSMAIELPVYTAQKVPKSVEKRIQSVYFCARNPAHLGDFKRRMAGVRKTISATYSHVVYVRVVVHC